MDVMIDIETLSTNPDASIATIGGIKFKRGTPLPKNLDDVQESHKLYIKVDRCSCDDLLLHVDQATLKWWGTQSEEAKQEVFGIEGRVPIRDALITLAEFVRGTKTVWANSPNFDIVILENAYRRCKLTPPWKFWNLRCCRTAYDLGGVSLKLMNNSKGTKTSHHALGDCADQIRCLYEAYENMGLLETADF